MKKNFIYLIIILFATFNYGCKKNKPKPGMYVGEFIYTNPPTIDPLKELFMIRDTGKDYIEISFYANGSLTPVTKLQKDNKRITGNIFFTTTPSLLIDGTWEKKKGTYIIEGTFTQSGEDPIEGPYIFKGTFELKSKK